MLDELLDELQVRRVLVRNVPIDPIESSSAIKVMLRGIRVYAFTGEAREYPRPSATEVDACRRRTHAKTVDAYDRDLREEGVSYDERSLRVANLREALEHLHVVVRVDAERRLVSFVFRFDGCLEDLELEQREFIQGFIDQSFYLEGYLPEDKLCQ